ncbi:MAG: DUF2757 family protein [Dethiobacter sp.]|nr:DUF2757 family protein [Dethiobacter sp.]
MKFTYLCERCGAIIGSMNISDSEMATMGIDPLTVDMSQDIIKSTESGGYFIYSLCYDCVDTMSLNESERPYRRPQGLH